MGSEDFGGWWVGVGCFRGGCFRFSVWDLGFCGESKLNVDWIYWFWREFLLIGFLCCFECRGWG